MGPREETKPSPSNYLVVYQFQIFLNELVFCEERSIFRFTIIISGTVPMPPSRTISTSATTRRRLRRKADGNRTARCHFDGTT